eukprot:tig00000658_g2914.t1
MGNDGRKVHWCAWLWLWLLFLTFLIVDVARGAARVWGRAGTAAELRRRAPRPGAATVARRGRPPGRGDIDGGSRAAGILIGLGAANLADAARDDRSKSINEYNQAVVDWGTTHRAPFAPAAFRVGGPASTLDTSTNTDGADAARIRNGDSDPSIRTDYTSARKQAPLPSLLAAGPKALAVSGECASADACTISVSGPGGSAVYPSLTFRPTRLDEVPRSSLTYSETIRTGPNTQTDVSRPCRETSEAVSQSCASSNKGGSDYEWRASLGRCLRSQRVASVCVQVNYASGSTFVAGSTRPCFNNTIETWTRMEEVSPATWEPTGTEIVEVRSARDPLVVASRITGGVRRPSLATSNHRRLDLGLDLDLGPFMLELESGGVLRPSLATGNGNGDFTFDSGPAGYDPSAYPAPHASAYPPTAVPQGGYGYPAQGPYSAYPPPGAYPPAPGAAYPPQPGAAYPGAYPPQPGAAYPGAYPPGPYPAAPGAAVPPGTVPGHF